MVLCIRNCGFVSSAHVFLVPKMYPAWMVEPRASRLQQLLADFLEPVFLETAMRTEEPVIGFGGFFCFEFQGSELDRADEVGRLGKPVIFGAAVFVHDSVC